MKVELLTASAKKWFLKVSVSTVGWFKVYERLTIRFAEKLARLSSKSSNIHDTKNEVFR